MSKLTDGQWARVTPLPGGGYNVVLVDVREELHRIEQEAQWEKISRAMSERMINELEITTNAIMRKVALNPSVFQIYDYVHNMTDPDRGLVLYSGDIGDFISECVAYAGKNRYGIQPTILYDLPSDYTTLRQMRARENAQNLPKNLLPHYQGGI